MPRLYLSVPWKYLLVLWGLWGCLTVYDCQSEEPNAPGSAWNDPRCPLGAAVVTEGYRRLALIVGVGHYKNPTVLPLPGAPQDAERFYALLTGRNGYGFPKENVCLLLDATATTARFRQVFEHALVARAQAHDVVVVYYAGEGSQRTDRNGDEPDKEDETILLQDARTEGVGDFIDDELHQMLTRLYAKTQEITVMFDSCSSGTVTRDATSAVLARYMPPAELPAPPPTQGGVPGDGAAGWVSEAMPGLIVFTAASDGESAYEINGRGVFTDALLHVLAQAPTHPLTYAQAARQIAARVAVARSPRQTPSFQGDLTRPVFRNTSRVRPVAWEVIALGPPIRLGGAPLPGLGKGAAVRIYDGAITGDATRDPRKAKATVVIEETTGLNATGRRTTGRWGAPPIAVGDLAVLARPADSALRLRVRMRPLAEPGGIPPERAAAVQKAIADDPEIAQVVTFTSGLEDFELLMGPDGQLQLHGQDNRLRVRYPQDTDIPRNLWQHARQYALLSFAGEGGGNELHHQAPLQVQVVPVAPSPPCAEARWEQAAPNTDQTIPRGYTWQVKVQVNPDVHTAWLVGGVLLSTDGSLFGFPADGRAVRLQPGQSVTFNARPETFVGQPPLDVPDELLVFGTQESNPVPWHLLTSTATPRASGAVHSAFYQALEHYWQPETHNRSARDAPVDATTWTVSRVRTWVREQCPLVPQAESSAPVWNRPGKTE